MCIHIYIYIQPTWKCHIRPWFRMIPPTGDPLLITKGSWRYWSPYTLTSVDCTTICVMVTTIFLMVRSPYVLKTKNNNRWKTAKHGKKNNLLVVHSFTFHSVLTTAINSEDPNASAGALPATAIPFPSADSTPKWQVLVDFLVTSWDFWRFPKLWVPPSHSFSHWLYKSIAFPVD